MEQIYIVYKEFMNFQPEVETAYYNLVEAKSYCTLMNNMMFTLQKKMNNILKEFPDIEKIYNEILDYIKENNLDINFFAFVTESEKYHKYYDAIKIYTEYIKYSYCETLDELPIYSVSTTPVNLI